MYDRLDEDRKLIADTYIEQINNQSGYELTNTIINLISALNDGFVISQEEGEKNISLNVSEQEELLLAIYKNIKSEEDKRVFLNEIIENERKLDAKIIDTFRELAQEFGEQDLDDVESTNSEENPEEEQTDEKTTDFSPEGTDSSDIAENEQEEQTEEKEQEEPEEKKEEENPEEKTEEETKREEIEGPAITQYKKETEELREKLAELEKEYEEKMMPENSETVEVPENNEALDEIIARTQLHFEEADKEKLNELEELLERRRNEKEYYIRKKQNFIDENPDFISFEDKKREYDLYERRIEDINREIDYVQNQIQIIKNKQNAKANNTVLVKVIEFKKLYEKEIEKLEATLKTVRELQDKYIKEGKGVPLAILGMITPLETHISKMKNDLHEKCGIRTDINLNAPENQVLIENVLQGRELNEKFKQSLKEKFQIEVIKPEGNSNTAESDKELEELKAKIDSLKAEVAERDNNIAIYYEALKDINEISQQVKTGKTLEDENMKQMVDKVKQKIAPLPESLKKELEEYLNKALTMEITNVKKEPKKWHKWVAGIAGLVAGGVTVAFAPGAALGVIVGTQLAKKAVNMYHNHLKKKDSEIAKENEVTGIEKPNEKQKGAWAKFKEKMKDENFVKNINWFLNGATIGAITMGLVNAITPDAPTNVQPSNTPATPETVTVEPDPYAQFKVGSDANGLDLSTGYDQANWAVEGINPETLNPEIMYDGNSVIEKIGVWDNGQLIAQGNSVAELQAQGFDVSDMTALISKNNGGARAWVNVAKSALGRVK